MGLLKLFSYHMKTDWVLLAPLDEVYDAIMDPAGWLEWWPDLIEASLVKRGQEDGVGSIWHYTWKTYYFCKLSFVVRIIEVHPSEKIVGLASGDLQGKGVWCLTPADQNTIVSYEWDIAPTRLWMRLLSPWVHGMFEDNHEAIMKRGGEGLAHFLGVRLVSVNTVNLLDR